VSWNTIYIIVLYRTIIHAGRGESPKKTAGIKQAHCEGKNIKEME
jgi:hypothetical protein